MNNIQRYPQEVLDLLDLEGFNEKFEEELRNHRTQEEAYEHTEQLHEQFFGRRKYSGYDSFRKVRERKLKKKQVDNLEHCSL